MPPLLQLREPPASLLSETATAAVSSAIAAAASGGSSLGSSAAAAATDIALGLPPLPPTGYSYVVFHVWFITITQRSVNLALTAGALTFCALQV